MPRTNGRDTKILLGQQGVGHAAGGEIGIGRPGGQRGRLFGLVMEMRIWVRLHSTRLVESSGAEEALRGRCAGGIVIIVRESGPELSANVKWRTFRGFFSEKKCFHRLCTATESLSTRNGKRQKKEERRWRRRRRREASRELKRRSEERMKDAGQVNRARARK